MFDVIKAAFVLANNGWLGAVLLTLSLAILGLSLVLFMRQKKLLLETRAILTKTDGFDDNFKDVTGEIDSCFGKLHEVIDESCDKNGHTLESRHDQITRAHEQMSLTAAAMSKDVSELKGMFNSVLAGIRVGIK